MRSRPLRSRLDRRVANPTYNGASGTHPATRPDRQQETGGRLVCRPVTAVRDRAAETITPRESLRFRPRYAGERCFPKYSSPAASMNNASVIGINPFPRDASTDRSESRQRPANPHHDEKERGDLHRDHDDLGQYGVPLRRFRLGPGEPRKCHPPRNRTAMKALPVIIGVFGQENIPNFAAVFV